MGKRESGDSRGNECFKVFDGKQRIEMGMLGQKGTGVGIANPVGSYPPELVLWVLLLQRWGHHPRT